MRNLEMNLVSEPDSTALAFQGTLFRMSELDKSYLIKKLAADWLNKELEFWTLKAAMPDANGKTILADGFQTMLNWILSDIVAHWHSPVMHHTVIKELELKPEIQRFISVRLPLLAAMVPVFKRPTDQKNSDLLKALAQMHIFPLDAGVTEFPAPLAASAVPNLEYLETFFYHNHWLLLLVYTLAAFQFFGYDQELLKKTSNN